MYSLLILFNAFVLNAQSIERIEPPNWWVNMKANELQIILDKLVGECNDIGATNSSRYRIFANILRKVDKQRKRPVLFLTN